MNIFSLYPVLNLSITQFSVRINLYLSACFSRDARLSLRELDQILVFGGTIAYGDSYLEFVFRQFKVIRTHAKLHDAAGVVPAHGGKGPGHCDMAGPG